MKKHKNMLVFVVAIAFIATVTFLLAPVNQQVAEAQTNSRTAAPEMSQVGRDQDASRRPGLGALTITELKRTASDGRSWDSYGRSVSLGDNVAAIGIPGDDDNGSSSGSVQVLRRDGNTWSEEANLTASDGSFGDQLGSSVSVDDEVLIAGAPNDNRSYLGAKGSAYVFQWNGSEWVEASKLTAADGQLGDSFGQSVSISGEVAVVGAAGDDDNGSFSGSAYVFRWNGSSWQQEAKLTADDGMAFDRFGTSVSISGNVALVGAWGDRANNNGWGQGAAYVFRWDGSEWQQDSKLTANDGDSGDYFGVSVSISNDVALIGAYGDKSSSNNWGEGSAYLFRRDGTEWTEEQKLKGDSTRYEYFGYSVSVTDDKALVGAYGNDNSSSSYSRYKGAAYLYRWNKSSSQWESGAKLQASDGANYDYFGQSVSLSHDVAIAGAIGDDDNGSNSGSAYLYLLDTSPPAANMSLSGSSFWVTLKPGDTTTETVTINNLGTGDLNWSASSDSAWLSPTPGSGTATSTIPDSVTLNIDATDLEPGEYEGRLTITAGDQTTTVLVWLTVSAQAGLPIVSPAYGFDNVPTLIYIQGNGFDDSTTVTLGSDLLEIKYVESGLMSALVPAGLDAGEYNVTVQTGDDDAITAPNAYEVIRSSTVDDLVSSSDWLWSDPHPLRVGYANSSLGLLVQHLGGRNSIDEVAVEFRLDSPVGPLLGREYTNVIEPFGLESTGKVVWEPQAAGEYVVCAIIDPDNELQESNEENNTVCRTLTVLDARPDVIAPEVENPTGFVISDDIPTTVEVTSTLNITGTDNLGGSGVQSLKYIEFEYILGAHRWVPVQRTPWITYTTAYSDYPWQLVPTFGMRYMQGWVADADGNISSEPGGDVIDLLPSEQPGTVAKHGVDFYRILLEEGETFTATLEPVDGDPDLYVWGPTGALWYDQPQTGIEQVTIDAAPVKGTYQIEVHGFSNAQYLLNFGATEVPSSTLTSTATPLRIGGRDLPENPAVPLDEWPQFYDVEAAPVVEPEEQDSEDNTIYLPITIN